MASETEIASNALTKLGAESITSLDDDDTQRARLCRAYYPNTRDAVLRAYPWRCATVRANLALDADTPIGDDWEYQFQLPVLPYCLRILKVDDGDTPYTVEGRFVLSNESEMYIKFIKRMEDTGAYDSLLQEAIECRLAAELAYPVTGSPKLIQAMWALYEAKLREARTVDGMEAPLEICESNSLVWER
jgi:hypothetical protein